MSLSVSGKEIRLGDCYKIVRKLGNGSFGEIYEVLHEKLGKYFACKAEHIQTQHPQLKHEFEIYQQLQQSNYFAKVYRIIPHGNHSYMIMDKLGESLEQLFTLCGRKFSIKCVCLIALQLISRIQELHHHGWLHRDVKPDNFLIGDGPKSGTAGSQIYMIDFGLGKRWIENSSHIPFKTEKRLIGTPRYASINTHSGYEQSRRDDLESLGYMLVYFVRGSLPWQGLKGDKEKKYQKIGDIKKKTELNKLCKGFPDEFRQYLASCRELAFTAQPAYDEYKQYFKNVLKHLGYDPDNPQDNVFDWQDENKLRLPPQERWPPRVTRRGGMTLPNLNGLVGNGVSVTLHTANHTSTNHNGSPHMLLQQIQPLDAKGNNNRTKNVNSNALTHHIIPNGYRLATPLNTLAGFSCSHGFNHGGTQLKDESSSSLPIGFPVISYNHSQQTSHQSHNNNVNNTSNNNKKNNNNNNNNNNSNNNDNTNHTNGLNNDNNNNSMTTNVPLSPQNFVNLFMERCRALEAERNRCKKLLEECLQEKTHACLQVDQWKQRYEERTAQLELTELQRQQLKIDNENLKRYIQELEMKCSQYELQPLTFQQLLHYQISPIQTIDNNNNTGTNKQIGNSSNTTTNDMTISNANGTTTHNSPASSPEQQISPGVAIRNLYTTTSTSTSPADGSHKHSSNDDPLNNNSNNNNGIGVSSSWTGRGLSHEHDMNLNMDVSVLDCIHEHQGNTNHINHIITKQFDIVDDLNRNHCMDNQMIVPTSRHVMGKKRKRFEIPITHEPQAARKRVRTTINEPHAGSLE